MSVTVITFLLPAGGAVLTIRNLQRLREIDEKRARELTVAVIAVLGLGFTGLLLASGAGTNGSLTYDSGASAVLSIGLAVASFTVQQRPFRLWRQSHVREPTGGWLHGIAIAVVYTLVTIVVVIPLWLIASGLLGRL